MPRSSPPSDSLGGGGALVKVQFTVGGKPQGKERPRLGKGGRVYTPKATKRFERMIAWAALGVRPRGWALTGRFVVEVVCYFPNERRRDCDNVLKSVMDGLAGVLYNDDSQVAIARVTKAIDRERPRTEVVVFAEEGSTLEADASAAPTLTPPTPMFPRFWGVGV